LFKPSVAHARCVVVAEKPTVKRIMGQRAIMAVGARGPDCTEAKLFSVRLRQHRRLWPDKTLAEVRFTVKNGRLRTHHICNGAGEKGLFTEAWVQLEREAQIEDISLQSLRMTAAPVTPRARSCRYARGRRCGDGRRPRPRV
jgi:hypothetical protein